MPPPLRWYLVSSAFYLIPGGIQSVMFPWLVAVYLHETPARVGFAQMAGQLPMVLLILFGGLLGDRVDQRSLLVRLHLLMCLPPLVMAVLVGADLIVYQLLLAWAFIGGVFGSFVQPARDALLSGVAGRDIQRVVMLVTAVQFGVQILGFALGAITDEVGPIVLMCVQAACMAACAWTTHKLPALAPSPGPGNQAAGPGEAAATPVEPRLPVGAMVRRILADIGEGIAIAWRSPTIRPAIMLTFSIGIFFAGTYVVVLPLMVRDLYFSGARGIALAFGANMLGTVFTIFVLMWRGGIERPGRALLLGASVSCAILSLLHLELPEWLFYTVSFVWGMCGGISMTMSRSIVQEAAPASHRARVMSVFQLGMMGGMPIGSVVLGWCVGEYGARNAVLVPVVGMACMVVVIALTSSLWSVRRDEPAPVGG
jgi:MFS family permease